MGNRKPPFGYKMVMGEIVVHPQEAQAVQGIYARYLAGASFNDITDHLKEKGPPYDADKPWNKNMVARILEDNRYAGAERFPAILSPEQLQEAAQRRSERKPAVQITEAQKALRRLCNGVNIHLIEARAHRAAQTARAEFQIAEEAHLDLVMITCDRLQITAAVCVQLRLMQPALVILRVVHIVLLCCIFVSPVGSEVLPQRLGKLIGT